MSPVSLLLIQRLELVTAQPAPPPSGARGLGPPHKSCSPKVTSKGTRGKWIKAT